MLNVRLINDSLNYMISTHSEHFLTQENNVKLAIYPKHTFFSETYKTYVKYINFLFNPSTEYIPASCAVFPGIVNKSVRMN